MPYIGKPQSADAFRVTPNNIDSELKLAVSGSNDSEMALATASIAAITASISRLNDEISTDDTDMTLATASIAAITASISRIDSEIDTTSANMTLATASIAAITSSISTINDNMTLATASIAAITASLGQPVNTDSNVTFNDINSTGTITAVEVHTTFVSSSIAVVSGSNIFGDDTADSHQFTGSLSVSGSLTATGSATVDGTLTVGGNIDFNSGTIDLSTQTVDVTLNAAVDALNFDSNTLSIDASNNRVGIGTASPASTLEVAGKLTVDSSNAYIDLQRSGTTVSTIGADSTGEFIVYDSSASTYRLVIDSSGKVGIGKTAPTAKLHTVETVSNTISAATAAVKFDGSGGDGLAFGNTQSAPYTSWIQAGYLLNGYSPAFNNGYPIALNPIGGNVGIGTTLPLGKLTISNAAGTNAPTTVTAANTYLQLGSDDYGPSNNGKFMIGFGFTDAINTNSPAYIGYEEVSTSGDTYGDLTFYTRSVTTDTAPTERLRIDSSGNVGIGTTSPAEVLHIRGVADGGDVTMRIQNDYSAASSTDETAVLEFYANNWIMSQVVGYKVDDGDTLAKKDGGLKFKVMDSNTLDTAMIINSNSSVTIGGSAGAANTLHVQGTGITMSEGDRDRCSIHPLGASAATGGMTFKCRTSSAPVEHFRIDHDGTLTATDTSIASNSDIRTKKEIDNYTGPITGSMSGSTSLELIDSLDIKHWKHTGDYGTMEDREGRGLIAQEVTSSVPYIVSTTPRRIDETYTDVTGSRVEPTGSFTDVYTVGLSDLIPDMLNAIKELSEKVKALEDA